MPPPMDCMENGGVLNTRYDKWFDTTANVLKDDGLRKVQGLVDTLFGTSWHKWNRYKLHRGIELVPWHKEWPPSWVYDLCHGTRRGLF